MSAPPSGSADSHPVRGYYPDPSIPGYIRYWSGTAWVPGTSRPAPAEGEPMPAAPAGVAGMAAAQAPALAAPVPPSPRQATAEETGPVFLDEEPAEGAGGAVWRADSARQEGFGGEADRRVSWGGAPGAAPEVPRARDPRVPAEPAEPAEAGGSLGLRPKPHGAAPGGPPAPLPGGPEPAPAAPQITAAPQARPDQRTQEPPAAVPARRQESPPPVLRPSSAAVPVREQQQSVPPQGPVGWAQQVHQLAAGEPGPWKPPPADDFFAMAAQAQGRPAPLGRRLGARLIDWAVLGTAVGAVAAPLWDKSVDHIDAKVERARQSGQTVTVWLLDGTTGMYLGIVLAVLLVGGVLYEALPTALWGSTLGKKLFGVRVLDIESHDKASFGTALRRWLVNAVLGVLGIGVLNVLWCLFDRPWRQCWHDKAARTFVASAKG
ncbi:hypothetical protein GCM10010359_55220 [Streptomyces morookaense]|nr:RDD family protein [Streptomyces morookaense]GHF45530.1 hypothetical protein GCM10010359_55220 [Streptomyces morookaense]